MPEGTLKTGVDFEVNEVGTINRFCLHTMALKAALEYIDFCPAPNPMHFLYADRAELKARQLMLKGLRDELGEDFQLQAVDE